MSRLIDGPRRFLEAHVPALAAVRETREAENEALFNRTQEMFESAQLIAGDQPNREAREDLTISDIYSWVTFSASTDEQGRTTEIVRYNYGFGRYSDVSSMGSVSREIDGDQTRYVLRYDSGLRERVTLTRGENGQVKVEASDGFESLRRIRRRKNVLETANFVLDGFRRQYAGVVQWQARQQGRASH